MEKMSNSKVVFVYLDPYIPKTKTFLQEYYQFTEDDAEYYSKEALGRYNYYHTSRGWKKLIQSFEEGVYYFFITIPILDKEFLKYAELYGFNDKLVWSSKDLAVNSNYPEDGPKLKAYLYRW